MKKNSNYLITSDENYLEFQLNTGPTVLFFLMSIFFFVLGFACCIAAVIITVYAVIENELWALLVDLILIPFGILLINQYFTFLYLGLPFKFVVDVKNKISYYKIRCFRMRINDLSKVESIIGFMSASQLGRVSSPVLQWGIFISRSNKNKPIKICGWNIGEPDQEAIDSLQSTGNIISERLNIPFVYREKAKRIIEEVSKYGNTALIRLEKKQK